MQLLVVVTNEAEKVETLFKEMIDIGIRGATVIDTQGMARVLHDDIDKIPIFGSLRMLINDQHPFNKTIFVVLGDNQVQSAINTVKKVLGNLSKPNAGILFTLPVSHVEGLSLEH